MFGSLRIQVFIKNPWCVPLALNQKADIASSVVTRLTKLYLRKINIRSQTLLSALHIPIKKVAIDWVHIICGSK